MVLFFTYSLLFGLGSSCTFSAGLVVIGKYFKKRQSLATGVLTAGHGGGVLVMGPTLEALVRITGSWQTTYRIMAGVAFILCSLAVTFDPNVESDEDDNDNQEKEERHGGDKAIEEGATKKQLIDFSVWKELPVIAIIVGACVVEFGHFVPQIHLVSPTLNKSDRNALTILWQRSSYMTSWNLLMHRLFCARSRWHVCAIEATFHVASTFSFRFLSLSFSLDSLRWRSRNLGRERFKTFYLLRTVLRHWSAPGWYYVQQRERESILRVPGCRICGWFEHNPCYSYHNLHTFGYLRYSIWSQRRILLHEFEFHSSHGQSVKDARSAWLGNDADISFLGQWSSISGYGQKTCTQVISLKYL